MQTRGHEPKHGELKDVRRRISEESWVRRVGDARRRLRIVEEVERLVAQGRSQNEAIEKVAGRSKRSATLRDLQAYREQGFEGLIDRRTPREPEVPVWVRDAVEVARMANGEISAEEAQAILRAKFRIELSTSTIKRIWKESKLERSAGRPKGVVRGQGATNEKGSVLVEPLEAAGMQLVQGAAEAETGAVARMVDTVVEVAEALPEPGHLSAKERKLRNGHGQLTARYNRARRKTRDAVIGVAHRTAEEKGQERDLGRLSFRGQRRETIERKVWALVSLPVVTPSNGRIEDLRGPQGRLLQELCGYEYQTETMRKVVSEFTVAGLGPLFQQAHASTWHKVSVERWETDYRASVVYVDNNIKPLWTGFFTKSAKVSSTGRVQPALTSTFMNTGVGVPIHFETHSGAAPLAPRVLELLNEVESRSEQPVGRLVVIDGECCSAGLLASFKAAGRDLVVPLPAALVRPERIHFGRGSAFRPYRDHDQIREGVITLRDSKSAGVTIEARAIVIKRRTKETWSVLVSLADAEQWSARGLADAYFGRWPCQEGFFRQANRALGVKRVHGYGKRVVTNTAVITGLEQTKARIDRALDLQAEETGKLQELEQRVIAVDKEYRKVVRYRAKREERIDAALEEKRTHTQPFIMASTELREATDDERSLSKQLRQLGDDKTRLESRTEKRQAQIETWTAERDKLQARTEIVEADVAQDTLFTAMKLTLGMLVHFIVAEYFKRCPIEWATFLSRIATLPGRRETTDDAITVYIYGNHRDIELMYELREACLNINERKLTQKGKSLRYVLEWPDGPPEDWPD